MQPAKDSFTVRQGSYLFRRYKWQQGGVTVDLTGASAKLQFRKSVKSDVVYEMSSQLNLITFTDNWIELHFTGESTAAVGLLDKIKLYGHLEVTLSNGKPYRIVEIDILWDPEITR